MKTRKITKPMGRPRQFDVDAALDQALAIFRKKGYEGTSLQDVTEAIGINRPSLYAAFGNKDALFEKVIGRYMAGPVAYLERVLDAPTARQVVEKLLRQSVDALTSDGGTQGCLAIQSTRASTLCEAFRTQLLANLKAYEVKLCQRLEQAKQAGDLPASSDPARLACYLTTVHHGLSMQAANGASAEQLHGVVDTVLEHWPV
jgi:AcrR family transcriptional regulator